MTDAELDQHLAHLEAAADFLRGMKRTRASTAPVIAQPAARRLPIAKRRWEPAARAFRRFPFESHTVRRICANHPEWATKLAGTWHVDLDPFNEYADKVDRGEASFDSSEKLVSSVANSPSLDENEHIGKVLDHEDDSEQIRETTHAGSRRT